MPMVRKRIKDIFKKDPETNINPDECVALGAAISASIEYARARQEKPPVDIRTYDVAGHQLGLVVLEPIEHRGAVAPAHRALPKGRDEAQGKDFLPEIALVQPPVEDGLVGALQLGERELLGHQRPHAVRVLDLGREPSPPVVDDLPMVEAEPIG